MVLPVVGYTVATVGAVVLALAAVPMAIGFGSGGILAGSSAAAAQSAMAGGAVTSGSLFAGAQGLGATGAFIAAAKTGGGMVAGGLAWALILWILRFNICYWQGFSIFSNGLNPKNSNINDRNSINSCNFI